jgi:DNA polymerase-2
LLTRHSRDTAHGCELELWLSTLEGPVKLIAAAQKPLFFIPQADRELAQASLKAASIECDYRPLELKNFEQTPMAGLYFNRLADHRRAAILLPQQGIEVLEADLRLEERFLMERFVHAGMAFTGEPIARGDYTEYRNAQIKPADVTPKLTVLSLDIECSRHGELFSIGLYGETAAKVLMIGIPQESDTEILWVSNERALLQTFEAHIQQIDPDIIIGWSVVNFDFRLLIKRAELHDIKLKLGRGGQNAYWRDGGDGQPGFLSLSGRVVVDGIDGLKSAAYSFDSFSLESVANALLGRGKLTDDVAGRLETIESDFIHNPPKLASYNLEDCKLVWDIFEQTQLLDYLCLRSQLTGLELDRRGGSVAAFTNLYLPKLHRAGYIAPSRPIGAVDASPGGYVMDSQPGLYQHVLVLDFKSLYPAIIRTFKIDPLGLIEGLLAPEQAIEGFRGGYFSREQHFLPAIIAELWKQRDTAKQAHDAPRSQAIKIIMNSFYGVLGSPGCRFFDPRLASSITMRGHQIMRASAQWIEEAGYSVIYGDTDSLFVLLGPSITDNSQADAIGEALRDTINNRWQRQLKEQMGIDSCLELEYETHYQHFLMPTIRGSEMGSKKRYAGMCDGKLVFKGLETVRSDWTALAKQFQIELYQLVFSQHDPSDFIRNTVDETRTGQRDHQLVYHKRLRRKLDEYVKNVPPQVRAARLADEHNRLNNKPLQYQNRGSIAYLITQNGPQPEQHQTAAIDYQHYIDKQLKPVAEAILPFIGLTFENIVSDQIDLF